MPIAWRNGIWRCSSVMPPSSGSRPTRGSGRPKLASSQATTMSQPSTISKPPPSAKPLTRAITGTSSVSRSAMPPKPPGRGAAQYSRPLDRRILHVGADAEGALAGAGQHHDAHVAVAARGRSRCAAARPRWRGRRRSASSGRSIVTRRDVVARPRSRTLMAGLSPRRAARFGQHLLGVLAEPRRHAPQRRPARPTCGSGCR